MSGVVDLLLAEVRRQGGNKAAAGRRCGISRTAVSLLLDGKYGAKTERVTKKVLTALASHECPWTGEFMQDAECEKKATAAPPSSSPSAFAQWKNCQTCLLRKPKEKKE